MGFCADLAIRSEQMWRRGPSAAVVPSRSEEDSHVNVAAEETEIITVPVEEEPTPSWVSYQDLAAGLASELVGHFYAP